MNETPIQVRKRIGEIFRLKREEMHLSIKEVENATSIRSMYLQAIEEGHVDKFLSPVYALGFVKQYASFLGFDAQKILDDNREAFQLPKQKLDLLYGLGTIDARSKPQPRVQSSNVFWIVLGLILLLVAYLFARFLGVF